jgi:hypothetical protein
MYETKPTRPHRADWQIVEAGPKMDDFFRIQNIVRNEPQLFSPRNVELISKPGYWSWRRR